jgi:hypothetical protein
LQNCGIWPEPLHVNNQCTRLAVTEATLCAVVRAWLIDDATAAESTNPLFDEKNAF